MSRCDLTTSASQSHECCSYSKFPGLTRLENQIPWVGLRNLHLNTLFK